MALPCRHFLLFSLTQTYLKLRSGGRLALHCSPTLRSAAPGSPPSDFFCSCSQPKLKESFLASALLRSCGALFSPLIASCGRVLSRSGRHRRQKDLAGSCTVFCARGREKNAGEAMIPGSGLCPAATSSHPTSHHLVHLGSLVSCLVAPCRSSSLFQRSSSFRLPLRQCTVLGGSCATSRTTRAFYQRIRVYASI